MFDANAQQSAVNLRYLYSDATKKLNTETFKQVITSKEVDKKQKPPHTVPLFWCTESWNTAVLWRPRGFPVCLYSPRLPLSQDRESGTMAMGIRETGDDSLCQRRITCAAIHPSLPAFYSTLISKTPQWLVNSWSRSMAWQPPIGHRFAPIIDVHVRGLLQPVAGAHFEIDVDQSRPIGDFILYNLDSNLKTRTVPDLGDNSCVITNNIRSNWRKDSNIFSAYLSNPNR